MGLKVLVKAFWATAVLEKAFWATAVLEKAFWVTVFFELVSFAFSDILLCILVETDPRANCRTQTRNLADFCQRGASCHGVVRAPQSNRILSGHWTLFPERG